MEGECIVVECGVYMGSRSNSSMEIVERAGGARVYTKELVRRYHDV